MHPRPRRLSRFALGAAILLTFATIAPAGAAQPPKNLTAKDLSPAGRVEGFKSASSKLAETDPALLGRKDTALVNVMIKLDYDATASYAGGIEGFAATSPQVTGKALDRGAAAVVKYGGYIASQESAFVKALKAKVPKAAIGQSFRTVYGGISAKIPANAVKDVLAIDGAVAVQTDKLLKLDTDSSPNFLGANAVYSQLGGTKKAGQGVIFGDLDTGVWPEHPSFADQGVLPAPPARPDHTARTCEFGDNPLTPAADPFVCQNKLIGGEAFLDTYLSSPARAAAEPYHTARDSNGHGTHTTSTAAGNVLTTAPVLGVERGPIHGIAPGAYIIEYKVCGIEGCFSSDSAAAVGEAILDGVDVINFSISGGTQPFTDAVELAFLDAYAAGVFVATSAGNEGPGAGTANHLSPWVASTAASTQRREFRSTLTVNGTSRSVNFTGASITAGVTGPLPIVLSSAAPYSRPLCDAPAAPGTFTGKIVACQRGTNARVEKGFNVKQGGAAGMVLYNPTLADVETDNHWLPTVHLADGTALLAFLAANPGATASFTGGVSANGQADVVAAFSSRGPAGNFIKPDIAAPGVQILAGHTPTPESILEGPPGQYFQAIAGTSMASPHVAGAAILSMDSHPSWTPGQVKSALMMSATTNVVKEDTTTPADPFDIGAGRIRINSADDSPLTMDETAHDMFAMANDPINAIHVNIPSINAPVMPGEIVTTREVKNVSGQRQRFDVSTLGGPDTKITVSPSSFTINNNQTQLLRITIESSAPNGVQQFARINIDGNKPGPVLHIPVAYVHTQGNVNLSQSCWQTSIPKNQATVCDVTATNNTFDDQVVDLDTRSSSRLRLIGANGATVVNNRHVRLHNVSLDGAEPGVPSVDPGELFGYIPLTAFGITPDAIGDEEIINYDLPPFLYNGVEYTSIGVDSNGYLLVGGGSSEDNNCCDLPAGPDPERPNNMLAPFWTDLDGTGAPGIYAAILTDGVDTWIVIEYRVNVFGTASLRTFQSWIGINGSQDITFAYAAPQTDPAGQDFLVGAENQVGAGDMTAVLPTADLRVESTAPTPGESVTYSVIVHGIAQGAGTLTTEMGATGVPGTTVVKTNITVTAP